MWLFARRLPAGKILVPPKYDSSWHSRFNLLKLETRNNRPLSPFRQKKATPYTHPTHPCVFSSLASAFDRIESRTSVRAGKADQVYPRWDS